MKTTSWLNLISSTVVAMIGIVFAAYLPSTLAGGLSTWPFLILIFSGLGVLGFWLWLIRRADDVTLIEFGEKKSRERGRHGKELQ